MLSTFKAWLAGFARRTDQSPNHVSASLPRAVDVGWLLNTTTARFIWGEPRRVTRDDPPARHAKSASMCPAVIDYEARMYEIACPIDVRLGFRRDPKGIPALVNLDGDSATIRNKHLDQMMVLVSEKEWRHPKRPIIQLVTPYVFVSDEPVYLTQLPPISYYHRDPWPGVILGGRMPIDIWPRQLMWAFEWWDTSKELVLKRGEPWFYLRFEGADPTQHIRLSEAEMTPELQEHINGLTGVSNYVDQTFSLFKVAQERRPKTLLVKKQRNSDEASPTEDSSVQS